MSSETNTKLKAAKAVLNFLNRRLLSRRRGQFDSQNNDGNCGDAHGNDRQEYPYHESTMSFSDAMSFSSLIRRESLATAMSLSVSNTLSTFAFDVSNSSATTEHRGPCTLLTIVSTNF